MSFAPSTAPIISLGVISASDPKIVLSAAIHTAGTTYLAGDQLYPPTGDAVITVLTVDAITGAILTISITTPGTQTTAGTNLTTTTNSVAGSGAKLNITVGPIPTPLNTNVIGDDSCFSVYLQAFKTQALGANTGKTYITSADGSQIIKSLAVGETWQFSAVGNAGNPFHLGGLFLTADNAADSIIG